MSYITKLRNVIKFQTATEREYEYLKKSSFYNSLIFQKNQEALLEVCLSHALKKVVKYCEVVHNIEPFRRWDMIKFDIDEFREAQIPVLRREIQDPRNIEYIPRNQFLVADFSNSKRREFLNNWQSCGSREIRLFTNKHLGDLEIPDVDYLDSLHKSSWRRVYDYNLLLLSCMDKDIAAYIKEQTKISKPMNIFKQILNREWGEPFDPFEVLKSIASPYYYVLPHQNERERSEFQSFFPWIQTTNGSSYISLSFKSRLIIAETTF
ncbi:uncharacterized protein TNIN_164911 [Trichonephila inaurata madagascariensis]|uniref:Uncharacterized protein n=1 Tax=Trichonephila inaurata madagascariensis TaxID=2747483 RepID=A0A8X6X822_9ARAC|nr:uncharacterized protein TNIN_164911 [Trichonephila inaurata madagascariensis]